jgi:hypothetical protein
VPGWRRQPPPGRSGAPPRGTHHTPATVAATITAANINSPTRAA